LLLYIDEEPQLKENEEIQHPLAYAPVKFKEYIKQEPEDEEAYCQSNVTEDLIQEASCIIYVSKLYVCLLLNFFITLRMENPLKVSTILLLMVLRQPLNHQVIF